jgi:hypothetical protein
MKECLVLRQGDIEDDISSNLSSLHDFQQPTAVNSRFGTSSLYGITRFVYAVPVVWARVGCCAERRYSGMFPCFLGGRLARLAES